MIAPPPPPPNKYCVTIHPDGTQLTPCEDISPGSRIFQVFATDLTPEICAKWLAEYDTRNRPRRPQHLSDLIRTMARDEFGTGPDFIAFNEDGEVVSGAHRMHACVATGKIMRIGVMTGLKRTARHFTDRPAAWTASNSLRHEGYDDPNALAGLVRAVWRWRTQGDVRKGGGSQGRMGMAEGLQIMQQYPELSRYVQIGKQVSRKFGARETPTVIALALFMFAEHSDHPGAPIEFWRLVENGTGLDEGDPAYVLRDKFGGAYNKKGVTEHQRVGMIINVYNAWVRGEKLGSARLLPESAELPAVLYVGSDNPLRLSVKAPTDEDLLVMHRQGSLL